jgi:TrpR family trp operon transcriptional repressor
MNKPYFKELATVIQAAAKDSVILEAFLEDLLTPKELEEIPVRWQIIKLLHNSVPQQEIAGRLRVGVATISRGSRELRKPDGGFNQLLKQLY